MEKAGMEDDDSDDKLLNSIKLKFKNLGGEFQYHRLNKEDALYLKKEYETDSDAFLNRNFHGGESFNEAIWAGSYGPSINGLELINDLTNEQIDFSQMEKKVCFFTDGLQMKRECLDYFYITEGKVFGSITIILSDSESFDPKKLTINYIEYDLEDYQEKYGNIIHKIEYDGVTCDMEVEDNGVDIYRCLIGYDIGEDDEILDPFVVYDSNYQKDWDWDICDEIFK